MLGLAGWIAGCSSKPPAEPRRVEPLVTRDVPSALRGIVGSEATLRNHEPVLVSGYGLVVGLNGTGGGELPERIAATMERELGLKGIGKGSEFLVGTPLEGLSPREMLRSRDVAVVIVYGAVIPGAPEGATFDVYVSPVSSNPDLSLEGGLLWSTELRLGPPTPTEGVKTTQVARAYGPIFINPFSAPSGGPTRQMGRVLGGGMMVNSLGLQLVLDNESHSRARAITDAINSRFGKQAGPQEEVARGRTARTIQIYVPPEYRDRAGEFVNILTAIQIQQGFPQEFAKRYTDALKAEPYLASDLSWCLQALPQRAALPFIRDLYESSESAVRMAALRAGAGLNDALAVPPLQRLAEQGETPAMRSEAVRLLGLISAGPGVDLALRDQLQARELTVRVAAYEALARRAELAFARRIAAAQAKLPAGARQANAQTIEQARSVLSFRDDNVQGARRDVYTRKFLLDRVPGGEPLVYVTQQGRPRIVLFGENPTIVRPTVFSMWDDRLMIVADSPTDELRVRYRGPDRMDDSGQTTLGDTVTGRAPADVAGLIDYLARNPTPEDPKPGLNLTYSEIVGVLYAMQRQGVLSASFAVEEDVLQARLLQATQQLAADDRPETAKQAEERRLRLMEPITAATPAAPAEKEREPLVVPLPQPEPKKK